MKNSIIALFGILMFISFSCIAQSDTAKRENKWAVGVQINSVTKDYPDRYSSFNTSSGWSDIYNLHHGNDYNKSYSCGISGEYIREHLHYRIKIDFTKINIYTDTYDTLTSSGIFFEQHIYDKKLRNDFSITPSIGWDINLQRFFLLGGFEIPFHNRGDASISSLVEIKSNGSSQPDHTIEGTINYGWSVGLGIFMGFNYLIKNTPIAIGGEFATSYSYYKNNGNSTFVFKDLVPGAVYTSEQNNLETFEFTSPIVSLKITYYFNNKQSALSK